MATALARSEKVARRAVEEDGFSAAVVYSSHEPEMPWNVGRVAYAIWRTSHGTLEVTRIHTIGHRIFREWIHDRVRPIPLGLDPRLVEILARAEALATGDLYEDAIEMYEVAADLAEELGDLPDAERSRVAARRLYVARWFAEQNRRREEITWQRVLPVRWPRLAPGTGREAPSQLTDWSYHVTPWDPEAGERYVVEIDHDGPFILRGGSP